jgi:hypothetical protein
MPSKLVILCRAKIDPHQDKIIIACLGYKKDDICMVKSKMIFPNWPKKFRQVCAIVIGWYSP